MTPTPFFRRYVQNELVIDQPPELLQLSWLTPIHREGAF